MSSKLPPYQPPSPFTPFLRRFTDERARELSDTMALYNEVRAAHLASPWANQQAIDNINAFLAEKVTEAVGDLPSCQPLLQRLDQCQTAVLGLETTIFDFPEVDFDKPLSLKQQVDLRRFLRAKQFFLEHNEKVADLLAEVLITIFSGIVKVLPAMDDAGAGFSIPLVSLLPDPHDLIDRLIGTFLKPNLQEVGLFTTLQQQFYENVCAASGLLPDVEHKKPYKTAADATDLSATELIESYLHGTPFHDLFMTPVPFAIPDAARREHWHLVGGSGHGKTQLLQHVIWRDLEREDSPALIIIDSQGEMLRKIEQLALFEDSDRLVIIDPEDDYPPALNMFDMSTTRLQGYSRLVREQVEAGIIELYNYVFGALAAELTAKQGTAFAFVTRLMMSIPGATIHTLRELMEEDARTLADSKFVEAIARLDPTARGFFENQFYNRNAFGQTRQQIARRLYGVLQVPAFDRMLSSPHSRLDMFAAMQDNRVVLVNTSKSLLKTEASALFGRFMIAQALRAAYERVAIPEAARHPAYLIIDEASEYFDASLETLLNQARKFNLGVLFAHQYLDQLDQNLRSSVAANTSIKMAGGISDRDARALAPDMRTTPDFLSAQRKDSANPPRWSQFACYVRNQTPSAVSLQVPFGTLERAPKMSAKALTKLKARNRKRYAIDPEQSQTAANTSQAQSATASPKTPPAASPTPSAKSSPESDDWRS